jgi:hypothetical protein
MEKICEGISPKHKRSVGLHFDPSLKYELTCRSIIHNVKPIVHNNVGQ